MVVHLTFDSTEALREHVRQLLAAPLMGTCPQHLPKFETPRSAIYAGQPLAALYLYLESFIARLIDLAQHKDTERFQGNIPDSIVQLMSTCLISRGYGSQ